MVEIALVVTVIVIAGGATLLWYFRKGDTEASWIAKTSTDLLELNLDILRLPEAAKRKFVAEGSAIYRATRGKYNRKRFAMRFFGWYATEFPAPDVRSFRCEGAISASIPIMRDWGRDDPSLKEASDREIWTIARCLFSAIEQAEIAEEDKIEAQLNLLQMMGAKGSMEEFIKDYEASHNRDL